MDEKVHGQPDQAKPPVTHILEITKGDDKGKTFELTEITRLGREVDNDVVLIDPRISRHHAKIESQAGVSTITDLGSSNKTYVNGVAVEDATRLTSGDRITLGEIELVYRDKSRHREDTLEVKA
ncbi:MAG: FHA domain-containing protein, partial [Anaerolineae bacterium]|nr:FHA domain-containing protein [Anaerolineae bacterium]